MPALHIETGVRDNTKNAARRVVCMCMPSVSRVRYLGHVPGSMGFKLYNEE
jgi:hypothetical protein